MWALPTCVAAPFVTTTIESAAGATTNQLVPGMVPEDRPVPPAGKLGLSLNAYCVRKLSAASVGAASGDAEWTIRRAEQVLGDDLVGVVVFGSWARGEPAEHSDVDVLVVAERLVRLTRGLYRRWDVESVTWDGRSVEPHFVHLPAGERPPRGLWAEVAVDGIVVYDRDYRLARWLNRVRESILYGRMTRQTVHGQPFWVEATADAES